MLDGVLSFVQWREVRKAVCDLMLLSPDINFQSVFVFPSAPATISLDAKRGILGM